jgi:hypothetical protein
VCDSLLLIVVCITKNDMKGVLEVSELSNNQDIELTNYYEY